MGPPLSSLGVAKPRFRGPNRGQRSSSSGERVLGVAKPRYEAGNRGEPTLSVRVSRAT